MRVFVAGASGAIGTRLVPQLIERGHEVVGTFRVAGAAPSACARSAPSRSCSTCSTRARCARPCSRREPDAIVHQATALADARFSSTSTAASRRRTGCAPRAPTRCWPPRARPACGRFVAQSFAACATRARAGRSRPRTIRSTRRRWQAMRETLRRHALSRRDGHGRRRDRAALRRLLRRRQRRAGRAGAQAPVPDRRRRRRRLLVHPPRRRRRRDRARARAGRDRRSTTSSTTSPPRCASGCPVLAEALGAKPPRHVPRWLARLFAGEARRDDGHRVPRRLEREGQARARLDAALSRAGERASRGRLRRTARGGARRGATRAARVLRYRGGRAHRDLERQLGQAARAAAAAVAGRAAARTSSACRRPSSPTTRFAELLGDELADRGYEVAAHGEATWNGVAILSRVGPGRRGDAGSPARPASRIPRRARCRPPAAASACVSVYVPNGREPGLGPLRVQARLAGRAARRGRRRPRRDGRLRRHEHRADRRRRLRSRRLRRPDPRHAARARGAGRAPGARAARRRARPLAGRARLHLLGLPRRHVPPGPRHADRPDPGRRPGGRARAGGVGRPPGAQGQRARATTRR